MKFLLTILCLSFSSGLYGQNSSLGYLFPQPVRVSPGQLISVFLAGNIQGTVSAAVDQAAEYPAPVLEVRATCGNSISNGPCVPYTAITIQIPYEMAPTCFVCAIVNSYNTQLLVTVDGATAATIMLTPLGDQVHILTACDTVVPSGDGYAPYFGLPCTPLVTHADGSAVSQTSPATGGEVVVAYAVGLGATNPVTATGQAATAATPAFETFALDFNFRLNALATQPMLAAAQPGSVPLYAGLAPGYVGLYQINFQVPPPPAGTPVCNGTIQSNLTVSVGGPNSFDGAGICVAP